MVSRAFVATLSSVLVAASAITACGEDGITPRCPALPLYDPQETGPREDPALRAELDEAVREGCATAIGNPSLRASGGSGGTGAAQGDAGAGGAEP